MIEAIAATGTAPSETVPGMTRPVMTPGFGVTSPAPQVSFLDMVAEAAGSSFEVIRNGDAVARAAVAGNVGTQEAVEALMAMETSLRTTLAVRDKVVEAYQEVMRMPV